MNQKLCINLHHVSMHVADVNEAFDRYAILLGLHGERIGQQAILRCMHEDFCLVLKPAAGHPPGLDYAAYELAPGIMLAQAQTELAQRGAVAEAIAVPVRGAGLLLRDPDGNRVVLIERRKPADVRSPMMIETNSLQGYHPRRFGHINYLTSNAPRVAQWYMDVLGFQLTDWIGDAAVWMHVDARHHVLAFLDKGYNHLHHIAFELSDWGEMRVALDHIAKHGRWVPWGPLRHGMAQNLASYWRMMEEETFIELFCDMQVLDEDHVPVTHPDNAYSSNTWGTLPPRSYFKFDAASIAKERESAQSYIEV
jgi:catechol-2,3-dioxygenase